MMNPIPIKWSRLWVLSLALCFFASMEVGFAQKAKFQTKDGKTTTQKVEDANSKKQQALKKQKALQAEKAKELPSVQQLQKSWDKLSRREQLALMKEIMLSTAPNSPHQQFVESKVGTAKMKEVREQAITDEKNKSKSGAPVKTVTPKEDRAELDPELRRAKEAEIAKNSRTRKVNASSTKTKGSGIANSPVQRIDDNGTIHMDIEPGISYNLKKLIQQSNPNISFGRKEDNIQARRDFELLKTKSPITGDIPEGIYRRSMAYAKSEAAGLDKNAKPFSESNARTTAAGDQATPWLKRGPFNVGGRTRALAFDVRDENILLAGGVSGGMWRSTDQGATWVRVTPLDVHPSVTDIVQDPINNDVWYYSTGERPGNSASGGGAFFQGNGIYKSIDNGLTWESLSATVTGTPQSFDGAFDLIWELAINPLNSDLYVSTFFGIYRSTDGGISFELVLPGEFDSDAYVAVTSTGVLYASVSGTGTAGEEGIYRSLTGDAGDWVDISAGSGFPTGRPRTVLGISPSNEDMIYLLTAAGSVWKYTYLSGDGSDAGGTWEDRSANLPIFGGSGLGDFNPQGGYNLFITVHPTDPNMVFMGATNLYRSTDGYASSANTAWIGGYLSDPAAPCCTLYENSHPDHHRLVFFNSDPNRAIKATDGGVALTNDITASNANIEQVTWNSLNNGYYTTQPYAGSIGPGDQIMAGFQDNSVWFEQTTDSTGIWADIFGGDGAYNYFNDDGTLRYVSSQNGNMFRVAFADADSDAPLSFTSMRPENGSLFITPFVRDPNNDEIAYFAGAGGLWRNMNASTANNTNGWSRLGGSGNISAMAVSTNPANVVYFGSAQGEVFKVEDGTSAIPAFSNISSGLPGGFVSSIDVDAYDHNHVIVVYSNYQIRSVWETTDGGDTWNDVSGNLEESVDGTGDGPSVQSISILGNGDVYLVGTSTGLYTTKVLDGTNTVWTEVPEVGNVPVPHLARRNSDGLVLASSHGNGLWTGTYEVSGDPRIVLASLIDDVTAIESAPDEVLDLSGVFESTVADAITITVGNNTNPGIVTASVAGTDLTLNFGAVGETTITLDATDSDIGAESISFKVTVIEATNTFPYAESFEVDAGGWTAAGLSSWELGTPNGFTISGASDGSAAWVTNATGDYLDGEQSFVLSPVFDFTTLTNPLLIMDIWWDIESEFDGAAMQYTTDGGTTWLNLGGTDNGIDWYNENIVAATGSTALDFSGGNGDSWSGDENDGSNGYVDAYQTLAALAGEASVQFRILMGADNFTAAEGFAFDNVRILDVNDDLGVHAIDLPSSGIFTSTEAVSLEIINFGSNAASNFNITLEVDGVSTTEIVAGPIAAGASIDYTFTATADLATPGLHDVVVYLDNIDEVVGNDTTEAQVRTNDIISAFPYMEGFESGDGDWFADGANSTWELGVPNGTVIQGASEGTQAWTTGLTVNYNNFEQSFVLSPIFDFTNLVNPSIEMDIWWDIESFFDGASLQSSTDLGATWQNVGTVGSSTNWYTGTLVGFQGATPALDFSGGNNDSWTGNGTNGIAGSGGYVTAFHVLANLAGEPTVQFRFVMGSDDAFNDDGFAFDNITIEDADDDLAVADIPLPAVSSFGSTEAITANIENLGFTDQANFNVTLEVDGGVVATEMVAGPLVIGDNLDYTFTATADLSAVGDHTIRVYVDEDDIVSNDTLEVSVITLPTIATFPYTEGFESSDGFWIADGDNSSWELGAPSATIIDAASEGTEAWVTNLTGSYNSNEQSFVASPIFDFTSVLNPYFSFDIWYDNETFFDGTSLQYTTDGTTWINVGTIGSGDNWYTGALVGFQGATPALDFSGGNNESWTGNGTNGIDGTEGYVTASHFLPMLAGESFVRFRVVMGSDATVQEEGFAFDNISIVDIQDDLGVFAIQLAEFGKFGATEEVTVTFENFGLNDIAASALTASIEVDGAVAVANEAITVAIPAGSSVDFTFVGTIDLSAAGDHDVRVFLDTPDDFVANDTTEAGLLNVPLIATYPYNESFEGDDGFWYSTDENGNNTWAHGSPNGFVIDDAADGTEAWVTNLDGAYVDSEQSFLNSVFFDFTAVANPVVSFNIWYDTENGFDGVSFQSSTDEGQTWTNVGTIGDGFNWYNGDIGATMAFSGGNGEAWNGGNGGWETAQILVPSLAGESCVQFRVVMGSDALFFFANGFDGVGIDNVTVTDLTDDLAIVGLAMEDAAVYGATSAIKVAVINNGVNDATNFEISYDVDGTGPVTETFAGPIAPGVTDTLIFTTTADLSVLGDHTLDIEIVTADDLLNNNSGSFDLFTLDFIVAAPYLENFETDPTIESGELGKWFDTAESDFAWTINSGSTTSGATGPDDDHSEPGENYIYTEASGSNEGDVAKLYTPGIDVTGFLHPTMSFWYHRFGSDLGDLEVILHDVAADTYTTVATLTGESQFDNGDDFVFSGYVPVDITGDQFSVIFRGTRGDGFNGDMTIDDFEVFDIVDNDLAIFDAEIINPFVPGQEPVIAYITNNGFQPQSNFDVTYTINGVGTVTDNIAGPLESGQTIEHTFSIDADVSAAGQSFDFAIFTSLPGDELVSNDTFAYNFTHPGIVDVYPYVESFETGNGGWRDISASLDGVPSSWELGMPIATVIDTASDGVNAWVTNLDGDYENSEESFVVGPVFDFTTIAEPVVLMDAWFESEEAFDGSSMQYSIDSGVTWVNIGLVGDRVNWYNLNLPDAGGFFGGNQLAFTGGNGDAWSRDGFGTYEIVSHEIFDLAGEATVLLRINFGSDGTITQEGMAFDRFRVVERTDLVTLTCAEDVEVPTDAGDDIATSVTIEAPAINNGVGTEVLTNDWTGTDDASGDFLAGYTELNWLVVGEEFADECTQLVLVVDEELPELTDCPTDTAFLVDTYLDSVMYSFDDPMISDNLEILTYSADQTLINRTEVMCPVAENGFLRIFDFEEDFATDADMIHVSGIEVGISNAQSISGTQPAVINIHTYDADLDLDPANFNLVYTDTIDMPDGNVFFFELPAGVDVPADLSLVAEVVTFGNFNFADYFMVASQPNQDRSGSTNSYIRADACGLADLDDFAFTGYEWVINLQVAPVLELDGIESGNNFGIGTNTQTFTTYDAYGNEVECEFDVDIVVDSIVVLDPTNITPTTFQANWGTVPGGKSYELEVIQVGTGIVVYTETVIGDNFAVVDAGLDDAFTYVYRVRANSGKIYTSFSDIMPVIFAPHTPVALTATDIDVGAFNSNWQSGGDNKFSTYTVELSNDDFATILDQEEVNNVTLTHRFTPGEGTYKYRVRATRETKWNDSTLIIMSEYSNMIEVVTLPNAPSNLTATASDIGSAAAVTLDWTDNSSTEVFFIVEKAVAGTGNFVPLLNADGTVLMLPADTETYVDMEVTALVTYAYRVVAIATDGSRSESNIAVSSIVSGTVDELLETSTTVSPNPSNAIFNLRMDNEYNGDLTFEIFDVVGKVIDRQEYKKSNVSFLREIDLGKVQSGIYLLRISSENGFITRRLVKQ